MTEFAIKDSGARQEFAGGMVRDTTEGKPNFLSVRFGPMLKRWAEHLTKGRNKYPDPYPGVPNWTLAEGEDELLRAKESAARHFEQWLAGERDEDHASAVFFNINVAEYVLEKDPSLPPGLGALPLTTHLQDEIEEAEWAQDVDEHVNPYDPNGPFLKLMKVRPAEPIEGPREYETAGELYSPESKQPELECNGNCLECWCGPDGYPEFPGFPMYFQGLESRRDPASLVRYETDYLGNSWVAPCH